jgi:hypothetical protein
MASSMQPPPLGVIHSWPAPNYVNPGKRGSATVIFNIVLSALLLFFIGPSNLHSNLSEKLF